MKVFKHENGKEVVYVQLCDIGFLDSINDPIPANIHLQKMRGNLRIIDQTNLLEYTKFEEQNEIDFFKELDAIVDYSEVKELTVEDLANKGKELSNSINDMILNYNSMSDDEKDKNSIVLEDYEKMQYRLQAIALIYQLKKDGFSILLPK